MSADAKLKLSDVGEFALIQRLVAEAGCKSVPGVTGPGDDCAIISPDSGFGSPGLWTVVTVDSMVEGRHFDRDFSSAEDIGWKLVTTTLSDIAAMGSVSKYGVISLGVPSSLDVKWVEQLYLGISQASKASQFYVLGGDTVCSRDISLSLTAIGSTTYAPVLRSAAVVGDDLWLSGEIGLSDCGLKILSKEVKSACLADLGARALKVHRRPEAQLQLGQLLGERGHASAMIDVSDGLVQDCGHLLAASAVSAQMDLQRVPFAVEVLACSIDPAVALTAGEDYQLLFCASADCRAELSELSSRSELPKLSRIGHVIDCPKGSEPSLMIVDQDETLPVNAYLTRQGLTSGGYGHF